MSSFRLEACGCVHACMLANGLLDGTGYGTPGDLVEVAMRALWGVPRQEGLVTASHLTAALHTIEQQQNCQVH